MAKNFIKIIIITAGLSLSNYGSSNNAKENFIDISKISTQNITEFTQYLHDTSNSLKFNDIIEPSHVWQTPHVSNVMFDLKQTSTWIKINLSNTANREKLIYFEFQPVFLEEIRIYDSNGDELDSTGSSVSSKESFAFPTISLSVPPGRSIYFAKLTSRASALSIMLRDELSQNSKSRFDIIMFAGIMGGLGVLMIYHLFMFFAYRQKAYLFYSQFLAATLLFTVGFNSFHKDLLPGQIGSFEISFWWSAITAPILFLTLYFFSTSLLLDDQSLGLIARTPKLLKFKKLLSILPVSQVLCIAGIVLFDNSLVLIPIRVSALLHMILLPSFAVALWKVDKSNRIASYYALSWVPFTLGTFLVVAWLSGAINHHNILSWSGGLGVLIQSTLLSFATGQQLRMTTQAKLSEQKAKLKAMEDLQTQFTKLSHRDRVITSFVSSDILMELDSGKDPLKFTPKAVNKCIVFLDMHGYTTFSESHTTLQLYDVINQYFEIINRVTYKAGGKVNKIIGDAMMIEFDNAELCLKTIVELRQELSAANKARVEAGSFPIKFGMGVSYGSMLVGNFGSHEKFDRTLVGDTVNVASRLESITRNFAVDVLCSKEFVDQLADHSQFRPAGYVLLKGRQKKSLVYEMFGHNVDHVAQWKKSTVPHLLKVIELELSAKYEESISVLQDLIEKCPPHTFKQGMIMDPTLHSMISAIEEKMKQLGISKEKSHTTNNPSKNMRVANQ